VWQPTWEAKIPALNCGFFKVLNTGLILFPLKSIVIYHLLQYNVLLKSLPEVFASIISQSFQNKMTGEKKDKAILVMPKKMQIHFQSHSNPQRITLFPFLTPKINREKGLGFF